MNVNTFRLLLFFKSFLRIARIFRELEIDISLNCRLFGEVFFLKKKKKKKKFYQNWTELFENAWLNPILSGVLIVLSK